MQKLRFKDLQQQKIHPEINEFSQHHKNKTQKTMKKNYEAPRISVMKVETTSMMAASGQPLRTAANA